MKDLREYSKQTNVRLGVGALVLLFVVGVGLIWIIYGGGAAGLGFTCLLAALVPIALILLAFVLIEWILKRVRPE